MGGMTKFVAAAAFAVAVSALGAPALAQGTDDARACNIGRDLTRADRIAACTRLIDAAENEAEAARYEIRRGELLTAEGEYEAALADLDAVIAANPSNWNAYADRATVYLFLDRPEDALADLNPALDALPRLGYNYYLRGLAEAQLGDYEAALADYDQAIQLALDLAWLPIQRGAIYLQEGQPEEARADFEGVLANAPTDGRAYVGLGEVADTEGDTTEAIRNYRLAQFLDPNFAAPNERLPELVPEATAQDMGPLVFAAPQEGLAIRYMEVVYPLDATTTEVPAADVGDVINWFGTRPTEPTPAEARYFGWVLGATNGTTTRIAVTTLSGNAAIVDQPGAYDHILMTQRSATEDGEGKHFVYRGLDDIWTLAPGGTATGTGRLMLDCPQGTDPVWATLGCEPNVPDIRAGTLDWTATFVGWEYVLVPAGYRLTARIEIDSATHFGFRDDITEGEEHMTIWYDPEIHWWVKRETIRSGRIETFEAVAIDAP